MIGREEFEFANDVRAALEQRAPRTAWLLIMAILSAMAVGTAWAAFATVDEVTSGQGRVIPTSQLQVVQTLEGGIVREILVHEGDTVGRDQVVMRIDDTGFASKLGELKARRLALLAELVRLEAEAGGLPDLREDSPLASEASNLFVAARDLFHARQAKLHEDVAILRQQLVQQRQHLAESEA
ncbi:MAG: HlyD family type I secretion periplasmic adaptor subunit, partial [Hyphomicrobiaceae bacterium]